MKPERMIEILAEVTQIKEVWLSQDPNILITTKSALTAIGRAVEEETATLRAEVERLKGCEAIVRELAETNFSDDSLMQDIRDDARQWAKG